MDIKGFRLVLLNFPTYEAPAITVRAAPTFLAIHGKGKR